MDDSDGPEQFTIKTHDGKDFTFPSKICEQSEFLKHIVENQNSEEGEGIVQLGEETKIDGATMSFIFEHLKLHNFDPIGVKADMILPDLSKNLDPKDFAYVKHLEGVEKIPETAKYIKALNVLDIKKLRQVYICIIATEYTLEGRTIEDMNKKFHDKLPKEYQNYEELTQDRMDELNKFFPFMEQKEKRREQEEDNMDKTETDKKPKEEDKTDD